MLQLPAVPNIFELTRKHPLCTVFHYLIIELSHYQIDNGRLITKIPLLSKRDFYISYH